MNNFDFNTAVNLEIANIARSRGEELIGAAIGDYPPRRICDYRHIRLICGHFQDVRIAHYRKTDYSCQTCFKINLESVAKAQGLELVSMEIVRYGNERLYRRPCGHTEVKSNSYLEKHKISACQECLNESINSNLARLNFTLVRRVRVGCLISCNICQNEWTIRSDTASQGTPTCVVCFEKDLEKDAEASGFKYLKDRIPLRTVATSRTMLSRWYSCNNCGHVDSYQHSCMRVGNVRCDGCYTQRLKSDAEKQGMTYVGHVKGMMHNYKLPCGCFRHIQPFAVRKGIWACKVHDDTFYHRPNGIYLLEMTYEGKSWLKLGFAKDMQIRTKGYGLLEGTECSLLFYRSLSTGYEAMDIEKSIHREMTNYKLDSKEMKMYMTSTGHTECYPMEVKDELLSRLERLNT